MKHKYKMTVDLNSYRGSIPAILLKAQERMRIYGDSLDIQSVWNSVVSKNLSYNEAIKSISKIVHIVDSNW